MNLVGISQSVPKYLKSKIKIYKPLCHKLESGPLMEKLHEWMNTLFDDKTVEPNSGLGKAFSYMAEALGAIDTLPQSGKCAVRE